MKQTRNILIAFLFVFAFGFVGAAARSRIRSPQRLQALGMLLPRSGHIFRVGSQTWPIAGDTANIPISYTVTIGGSEQKPVRH